MKALVRREGETVTESMGVPCIDWNTGAPLTNAGWFGGAYQLVLNYVPPVENIPEIVEPEPEPESEIIEEAAPVVEEETVVINGVTYTKAQLREMLGE